MRTPSTKRDRDKYCRYHRDHGHDTDDCWRLKAEIEKLVQKGHLQDYVARSDNPPKDNRRDDRRGDRRGDRRNQDRNRDRGDNPREPERQQDHQDHRSPDRDEICILSGGFAGGGTSNSARKSYVRKANTDQDREVHTLRPSKQAKTDEPTITFSGEDKLGVQGPHDDPLVVTLTMSNTITH